MTEDKANLVAELEVAKIDKKALVEMTILEQEIENKDKKIENLQLKLLRATQNKDRKIEELEKQKVNNINICKTCL